MMFDIAFRLVANNILLCVASEYAVVEGDYKWQPVKSNRSMNDLSCQGLAGSWSHALESWKNTQSRQLLGSCFTSQYKSREVVQE